MSIKKFFKANTTFVEYIQSIGFKHHQINGTKQYYVNDKGNQIKIDFTDGIISLLDNKGYTIDYSNVFNNKQIEDFTNSSS